jgi:hypothetical protein
MQSAGYRRIPVKSGDSEVFALVDPEDFERLSQHSWHLNKGYVVRNRRMPDGSQQTNVRMAREILGLQRGDPREGDHINRQKLDNRRSNLRVVTHAVNGCNVPSQPGTSRHRGVHKDSREGVWRAQAGFEGTKHFLGRFGTEREAAAAVNAFWIARGHAAPNEIA